LNEFYYPENEPLYTARLRAAISVEERTALVSLISATSFARAAKFVQSRLSVGPQSNAPGQESDNQQQSESTHYKDPVVLDRVIRRYLANKKLTAAVADAFGVKTIFVWQPVPMYNYDQRYHMFSKGGYSQHTYAKYGYERMAKIMKGEPSRRDFLWSADIQNNLKEPLYVDNLHYSTSFSKQFATVIAESLIERNYFRK
jgi:hypothetical protein